MLRFEFLERQGAFVAAISEVGDGDCARLPKCDPARRRLLEQCEIPNAPLATVHQVHGTKVVRADADSCPEADGLFTTETDLALGITVADCVPVYLLASDGRAAALLHAGRAGTRANIAGAGVHCLGAECGVPPHQLKALIGPSAGPCCYEVDAATARDFADAGMPVQGRRLDLWEANRRQLMAAGLDSASIAVDGHCTLCGDRFFSYRRGAKKARNLAVLSLQVLSRKEPHVLPT
jgi:polyphenol oxidase